MVVCLEVKKRRDALKPFTAAKGQCQILLETSILRLIAQPPHGRLGDYFMEPLLGVQRLFRESHWIIRRQGRTTPGISLLSQDVLSIVGWRLMTPQSHCPASQRRWRKLSCWREGSGKLASDETRTSDRASISIYDSEIVHFRKVKCIR